MRNKTASKLLLVLMILTTLTVLALPVSADGTYQTLPISQDWTNAGLITTNDDWSGVPGIMGYRGDDLTTSTGTDPQTILADGTGTPVDVNANRSDPDTFATGGVTEFDGIANGVVALAGSGTADAPFLLIYANTTGKQGINISYNLRDIDGSIDNAVQQVALQYRIGTSGNFTNLPAGYVADATTGPSLATLVTPVNVTLPSAADNQAEVQIRIITTNAGGNDEWVGVDDISVTGGQLAVTLASFGAEPQANQVQITWETVSELNNAGFNLYRSSSADGADRALLAFVPSQSPGSTAGASYSVTDAAVTAGQTYWYLLEDVDLNGATTLHGPVSATVNAPTAVTLASLQATPLAPAIPAAAAALAGLAGLMAAAGVAVSRRRAR